MEEGREALRKMPLWLLEKAYNHYQNRQVWFEEGRTTTTCVFCKEYFRVYSSKPCLDCPFFSVVANPWFYHCVALQYNNTIGFGRIGVNGLTLPLEDLNDSIIQWWLGFLSDLEVVIGEKKSEACC